MRGARGFSAVTGAAAFGASAFVSTNCKPTLAKSTGLASTLGLRARAGRLLAAGFAIASTATAGVVTVSATTESKLVLASFATAGALAGLGFLLSVLAFGVASTATSALTIAGASALVSTLVVFTVADEAALTSSLGTKARLVSVLTFSSRSRRPRRLLRLRRPERSVRCSVAASLPGISAVTLT